MLKPAKLPFFDDLASYGHGVLGFASAAASPGFGASVALVFLIYQFFEAEPVANKLGDFGEFMAGYLAGVIVHG